MEARNEREMQNNKDGDANIDKKPYTMFSLKKVNTVPGSMTSYNVNKEECDKGNCSLKSAWHRKSVVFYNYLNLVFISILIWGLLWSLFGDGWAWNGQWFRISAVAIIAWASGQLLQAITTLPPLLAALVTGILARNLGFLDMNQYTEVDNFLRKIYPVIILGKASLGWDLSFMKNNWLRIATLGVLPWLSEVIALAVCVYFLLGFPVVWGFLLGAVYASLSCAVIMPAVVRISNSANTNRAWGQLVCTAGGIDTALSVGVYGLILSFMFFETNDTYRIAKAALTLLAGVAIGVVIGTIAGVIPHSDDFYLSELRIAIVVIGGLLANAYTSMVGWSGAGGVAVLVGNATAATFWARKGWKLNNNPASTAYRVMWSILEPMVFAYSGTFFEINSDLTSVIILGFGILAVCLFVRLSVTCLVCWSFTLKEKIFICCTWIPKSIVEAVLCPVAINTLILSGRHDTLEMEYAVNIMRLLVQEILITTTLGYVLTNYLGPRLLRNSPKNCENDEHR